MDDLFGADAHLEAAYEDANGGQLDTGVESETYHEDDDIDVDSDDDDDSYDREADYWKWSDRL